MGMTWRWMDGWMGMTWRWMDGWMGMTWRPRPTKGSTEHTQNMAIVLVLGQQLILTRFFFRILSDTNIHLLWKDITTTSSYPSIGSRTQRREIRLRACHACNEFRRMQTNIYLLLTSSTLFQFALPIVTISKDDTWNASTQSQEHSTHQTCKYMSKKQRDKVRPN